MSPLVLTQGKAPKDIRLLMWGSLRTTPGVPQSASCFVSLGCPPPSLGLPSILWESTLNVSSPHPLGLCDTPFIYNYKSVPGLHTRELLKNTPAQGLIHRDSCLSGLRWGVDFWELLGVPDEQPGPSNPGTDGLCWGLQEGSPGVWASRFPALPGFSPPWAAQREFPLIT